MSDEELVLRWTENVQWQFFSGMDYCEPRLPCGATQIGRFRRLLGKDGIEQLLKATIDCAVGILAVKPDDLERVIVDATVQSKAIAHPVDSRLLEIARHKVVAAAKRCGISLKQTYAQEGKTLCRKAGGYAEPGRITVLRTVCAWRGAGPLAQRGLQGHAKQFTRLRKTVKRQRTILGVMMREVRRKQGVDQTTVGAGGAPANEAIAANEVSSPKALSDHEKKLLNRRQAIEPLIGHAKADHRLDRCWFQGAVGDALHALSVLCCAAGDNIRWLLWAITRLGLTGLFCALRPVGCGRVCRQHAGLADGNSRTAEVAQHKVHLRRNPYAWLPGNGGWMNFAGLTAWVLVRWSRTTACARSRRSSTTCASAAAGQGQRTDAGRRQPVQPPGQRHPVLLRLAAAWPGRCG